MLRSALPTPAAHRRAVEFVALASILLAEISPAAASPVEVSVRGEGCPDPARVVAMLAELLPRTRVSLGSRGGEGVRLTDLGPRYRVEVGAESRELVDEQRDCESRARSAAVLAALILDPPSVSSPPGAPDGAKPRPAVAAPVPSRTLVDLEIAGSFTVAPRSAPDATLATGGGALRLVVGPRSLSWLAFALGVEGLAPASANVAGGGYRLARVPFDLDARLGGRRGRIEGAGFVGLQLAIVLASGQGFPVDDSGTRVEAAVRAGAILRVRASSRLAPFLAVDLAWVPRTHQLGVDPSGPVATTPPLWIGLSAGVAVSIL